MSTKNSSSSSFLPFIGSTLKVESEMLVPEDFAKGVPSSKA